MNATSRWIIGAASVLAGCEAANDARSLDPHLVRPTVAALRPDTPDTTELPPRYEATELVESVVSPSGAFRVHFTRDGRNAVPDGDEDADGTPDYVELVTTTYDDVLAFYTARGFARPPSDEVVPDDHGGDGLFDVYLVDFGGSADGAFRREACTPGAGCTGYMVQENDFARYGYPSAAYAARVLASHEFFHAVQAAYEEMLGAQGTVLSEATAVWATEEFDASLGDLEHLAGGYTSRTDRSLGVDPIGAAQPYAYGAGLFFVYLDARVGDDVVRTLLEDLRASGEDTPWLRALDEGLARDHGDSFAAAFVDFAEWTMFLGARADETRGLGTGRFVEAVARTEIALPFRDESVRFFPAAFRAWEFTGARATVALEGEGREALDVVLVAFADDRFVSAARGRGAASIDAPGADHVAVLVVNDATDGASRVLALCVGAAADDCATTDAMDGGVGDAGGGATVDAGVVDDGATPWADASTAPRANEGGCAVVPGLRAPRGHAGPTPREPWADVAPASESGPRRALRSSPAASADLRLAGLGAAAAILQIRRRRRAARRVRRG